jgi:hypothetical protein
MPRCLYGGVSDAGLKCGSTCCRAAGQA